MDSRTIKEDNEDV